MKIKVLYFFILSTISFNIYSQEFRYGIKIGSVFSKQSLVTESKSNIIGVSYNRIGGLPYDVNTYTGYNFGSWNISKILYTMASDNSYQYVTYKQFTDYTRIRFEGNASTSGTVGSGNIVWETTFFNPAAVGNISLVEIRCGSNGRGTQFTMGIAGPSSSTAYASHSSLENQSVVYVGNVSGTAYTAYVGSYVNYTTGL